MQDIFSFIPEIVEYFFPAASYLLAVRNIWKYNKISNVDHTGRLLQIPRKKRRSQHVQISKAWAKNISKRQGPSAQIRRCTGGEKVGDWYLEHPLGHSWHTNYFVTDLALSIMAKTRLTVLTVQKSGNPVLLLLLPRVTSVRALKCDVVKSTCNVGPRERSARHTYYLKTPTNHVSLASGRRLDGRRLCTRR